MGFDFKVFEFWVFYLNFATAQFSRVFLAWCWSWTWIIHRMLVRPLLHFFLYWDVCHIPPKLVFGWVFYCLCSHPTLVLWSSWWWCTTHEHMHMHLLGYLQGSISHLNFGWVMFIGVGLGICIPTSAHRWMSMGRVGEHHGGASTTTLVTISQVGMKKVYLSDN